MDGIKITVVGLDDTTKSIEKVGTNVSGRQLMTAVLFGTELILSRAKQLAPYLTGTLYRSLHIGGYSRLSPGFDTSQGYSDIGGNVQTANRAKVETGTNIIYGPRMEFGFVGKDSLGRVYNQPAYPYLRPAFDEKQDACVQEISDALDVMIGEALK